MQIFLQEGLWSLDPTVLYKLGLIKTGFVWRVHRAVYGLREAPSLWAKERTKVMETMTFRSRGETYRVLISEIHRSTLLLVREQDVFNSQADVHWSQPESTTQGCLSTVAFMWMTIFQLVHMTLSPHSWSILEPYG